MFVSNFNRNSITIYDLEMGPYGMMISDTPMSVRTPTAWCSPSTATLVFENYTGEVDDNLTHASIGLLDVNEDSSTTREVLTWLVNL